MSKLKIGVCSTLMSFCLVAPLSAKIDAKDRAEKTMQSMATKGDNFIYNCKGDDTKASCTAKELVIDKEISLRNIKFDYAIDDKNLNSAISFDLRVKSDDIDASIIELIPKSVSCTSPSSLQGDLYKGQINCDITSPSYVLQLKGSLSMESDRFVNKDVSTVVAELEDMLDNFSGTQKELQDFKVDPREFVINIKSMQLGNKIFNALKKEDPTYTKEQYVAAVNMGVAMVPVGLANAKTSESTTEQITKAATALGDIATSKKQQATISFNRKSAAMLDLADLPNFIHQINSDPLSLLKYLDEYQISVISR